MAKAKVKAKPALKGSEAHPSGPSRKFASVAKRPALRASETPSRPPQVEAPPSWTSPAPAKVHWHGPKMPIITPYLSVRDGVAALAFYEKVFGFKRRFEMKTPEGRLRHGELEYGQGVIMLGECSPEIGYKAPADVGGSPVALYVYVPDVDAVAQRAKAAGATIVVEPKDQFYGDRTCELVDPEGHRWSIATHVKDVNPEELKP